jgi:AhpC/TSA family
MMRPLQRSARLAWLGIVAGLRTPGLRLVAVIGALAAAALAWNASDAPGTVGVLLAGWLGRLYSVAAALWFAYTAIRDLGEGGATLRAKPVDGAAWVTVIWATGIGIWLALLGLAFLVAALVLVFSAGPVALVGQAVGFVRAGALLVVVATWSFALSRMLRSPLGGILTLFAWFCAMAGLQFIPAYLRPDFTQNLLLFLAASAFLLFLAALLVEPFRRGELRRPLVPLAAVLVCLLVAVAGGAQAYRLAPEPTKRGRTVPDRIASQHREEGKQIPGFWLPDGRGGMVRTAAYPGRILLIYLFASDDLDAVRMLPALDAIAREYGDRGVQPIGVCLSPDQGDGWALARTGGYHFPIASDPSTTKSSSPPEAAITSAYDANNLPLLFVTDRHRRAREVRTDVPLDVIALRQIVMRRLKEEPE